MIVIGIDGSTKRTGIAAFKDGKYLSHTLVDYHKITDVNERMRLMMNGICDYLDNFKHIDKIIMEKSIMKNNIDTVQKLSNLAGAIMCYAARNNIEFVHPVPSAWRKIVGLQQSSKVKREALKLEAIEAVSQEYGMELTDDEAESLLLARSGFDLPKIVITSDDVFWGEQE